MHAVASQHRRSGTRAVLGAALVGALAFGVMPAVTASGATAAAAPATGSTTNAPVYAQSGNGAYRDRIAWISWGAHDAALASGTSITNWHETGDDQRLEVTCTVNNLSSGTVLNVHRPGQYAGDGLDEMYGGLASGIATSGKRESAFTVSCTARVAKYSGPGRTAADFVSARGVPLSGLVFADAESTSSNERIQAVADNGSTSTSPWHMIDRNNGGCQGPSKRIRATHSSTGSAWTLRLENRDTECTEGAGTPNVVMFAAGVSQLRVTMKDNGRSAAAIGYVLGADYGDAPESYGIAAGILSPTWTGGQIPAGTWLNPNPDVAGYDCVWVLVWSCSGIAPSLASMGQPSTTLGKTARTNTAVPHSADASGDIVIGSSSDEDALGVTGAPVPTPGVFPGAAEYQMTIRCRGGASSKVVGWMDWNINGTFDGASERSEIATCNDTTPDGGVVTLKWLSVPADAKSGNTFLRLRISTDENDLTRPVGPSVRGEVEDWPIKVRVAKLEVQITTDVAEVPGHGGRVNYTITLSNTSAVDFLTNQPAYLVNDLAGVLDDAHIEDEGITASAGTPAVAGDRLTWSGALAAGATVTVRYRATVAEQPEDRVMSSVVQASLVPITPEAAITCEWGSTAIDVKSCARSQLWALGVEVTKTAFRAGTSTVIDDGGVLEPGAEVEWEYVVTNTGSAPLTNVRVSDTWTERRTHAGVGPVTTTGDVLVTCSGQPAPTTAVIARLEPGAANAVTCTGQKKAVVPDP